MTKNINKVIIILGIVLLGMILRSPITSVGAISGPLKAILNINNTVVGLITTIPLIAFALCSPVVSKFSGKLGLEKTVFYSALIIAIGLGLRFYLNTYMFFIATFIIGVGITVGNVLLPGIAKKYFPENLGVMTGFYAVVMNVSASVAAGVSYPILSSNIGGEKFSTGLAVNIWLIVSILNIVIYAIITKNSKSERIEDKKYGGKGYLTSLKMWSVMLSMGLQSALFYCSVSWFAEIMISKGFTPSEAGLLLSISQFAQFPSTFLVPVLAEKIKNKLIIPIFIAMGYVASLIGMIYIQGNFALMTIYIVLFALAGGGSFSYVMYLFSAKSKNEEEAADISGLAQAGGYWLAAIFPPLLGYVRDVLNWDVAIYILIMTASLLFITLLHSSSKGNIIEIK